MERHSIATPMPQSATSQANPATAGTSFIGVTPPHTQTQSTLAPTAEFTRIFLLAWIIRYIFRGFSGATFEQRLEQPGIRAKILNAISVPGRTIQKWLGGPNKLGNSLTELEAGAYSGLIGLGSAFLSLQYGKLVKSDILNIFRETVADEKGIPQEQVTFDDIRNSDNNIIKRTVENYRGKMWERLGSDALFFLAAPLKSSHIVDGLLGLKGVQIFADTWKRKTTLFEDLVTFINNKINPRNGLGQPITIGEVFDLYQHYADKFHPQKMFKNVLSHDPVEIERWGKSQAIFQRMTELLNQTYAYKHTNGGDTAPHANNADFALPKFIYLLGHDLIDPDTPEATLTAIEVMNRHGANGIRSMQSMLQSGATLADVQHQLHVTLPVQPAAKKEPENEGKNGVIAKGSTMQLDAAPISKIAVDSIAHEAPQRAAASEINA